MLLGLNIGKEFRLCKVDRIQDNLHIKNPRLYEAAGEDARIENLKKAIYIYNDYVTKLTIVLSPKTAFSNVWDIRGLREQAVRQLKFGITVAKTKKPDVEEFLQMVIGLKDVFNENIQLFNACLVELEDRRRIELHNDNPTQTSKAKVLRPVKLITDEEIGI
jgi:hypothetical protein